MTGRLGLFLTIGVQLTRSRPERKGAATWPGRFRSYEMFSAARGCADEKKNMTSARKKSNNSLVYSSDRGRMCPDCGKPKNDCTCRKKPPPPPGDGVVRVGRETKGRKGKSVSIVSGIPLGDKALVQLARRLKSRCGSGGTVKDGVIEIQGDHRDLLVEELKKEGFSAKSSGG